MTVSVVVQVGFRRIFSALSLDCCGSQAGSIWTKNKQYVCLVFQMTFLSSTWMKGRELDLQKGKGTDHLEWDKEIKTGDGRVWVVRRNMRFEAVGGVWNRSQKTGILNGSITEYKLEGGELGVSRRWDWNCKRMWDGKAINIWTNTRATLKIMPPLLLFWPTM